MGDLSFTLEQIQGLMRDGFIAALAVGLCAPWIGTLLVLRRMPFVGIAIPEIAGAGVAFTFLCFPMLPEMTWTFIEKEGVHEPSAALQIVGAGLSTFFGLLLLASFGRRGHGTGLHAAVAYVMAVGLAEISLVESDFHEFTSDWLHHGRLLLISEERSRFVAIASLVFLCAAIMLRRPILLSAFDQDLARLRGLSSARWLFLTLLLLGGYAALTVPSIGPDVLLTLFVLPPVLLRRAVPSLRSFGPLSSLAGLTGTLLAFHLSISRDWPIGPSVALSTLTTTLLLRLLLTVRAR